MNEATQDKQKTKIVKVSDGVLTLCIAALAAGVVVSLLSESLIPSDSVLISLVKGFAGGFTTVCVLAFGSFLCVLAQAVIDSNSSNSSNKK